MADESGATVRREAATPGRPEPGTLVELFLDSLREHAELEAKRVRGPGGWESLTHEEFGDRVRETALGLQSLGLERGDRVAIVSDTRMEWAQADFALLMSGLVGVPVYPSLPAGQMRYILEDAGASVAFVADQEQYDKLAEIQDELPGMERAFAFDDVEPASGEELPVETLDDLGRRGAEAPAELAAGYEERAREAGPDDLATLIYTSGTTGAPKGVMLTHDNFVSNVRASCEVLPVGGEDVALSWLPLAHVFERMAGHYLMWCRGATVAYAGSVDTVARDMGEVSPTIMTAVPRLYEKFLEKAEAAARDAGGLKAKIFDWAREVGEERASRRLAGRSVGPWLALRHAVADRLVFSKLRDRTGGRIRYFISGGAPLPVPVGLFLWAAGLEVLEGYGLTETSPVLCVNPPERPKLGTVGPPIAGTELRIADDGEILARGPQVMRGYYRNQEATDEVLDEEGWLQTGDIGELDRDGYLAITDRKKELIVTSQGKNIAPSPLENAMQRSRFIEYAVLIGDQRKFPIVVIQPAFQEIRKEAGEREAGELIRDEEVRERIRRAVSESVADFAHHERPGEILLVASEFSVEGGELTPTMKVKRREVEDRWAEEIDRVYREAEEEGEEERISVKVEGGGS